MKFFVFPWLLYIMGLGSGAVGYMLYQDRTTDNFKFMVLCVLGFILIIQGITLSFTRNSYHKVYLWDTEHMEVHEQLNKKIDDFERKQWVK